MQSAIFTADTAVHTSNGESVYNSNNFKCVQTRTHLSYSIMVKRRCKCYSFHLRESTMGCSVLLFFWDVSDFKRASVSMHNHTAKCIFHFWRGAITARAIHAQDTKTGKLAPSMAHLRSPPEMPTKNRKYIKIRRPPNQRIITSFPSVTTHLHRRCAAVACLLQQGCLEVRHAAWLHCVPACWCTRAACAGTWLVWPILPMIF